ncbi:adenylate/guanylate cyclase domain-containing protein [Mycobacterium botniense]|uniref:Adenylate/guanylate cyclase domain-containing protein n=1 Tax=Mycobacterium botniense TaxID=84962 RepID=A0A7I9XZD7_9MYCO|nr:adenylate/guanylate cyclase domain-containing protein [Mycobacterium botniense]GFG75185.1 adenylate/guanylate cyclase domain-containing protein [Mycobacterium botniense]
MGLTCAHVSGLIAAAVILIPLNGHTGRPVHDFFAGKNLLTIVVLVVLGGVAVWVGGVLNLAPALRWFSLGQEPDPQQRRTATKLAGRQSLILVMTWAASGMAFILLNRDAGSAVAVPALLGVAFGAAAAVSTSLLLTQRPLRAILAVAARDSEGIVMVPGVLARLVLMWLLCSALPCGAIASLMFIKANGWILEKTAAVEIAIVVVSLAAVLLGLPVMILTSRSISDPIHEVIEAMAAVERGRTSTSVAVYERSEIGRLQSGFNRMVAGIAERERLRDLFGRHVGADVARRALQEGVSLSGDVREAAILFIDLVGSTNLAANRPPQEVAQVLNNFFQIVVHAVDRRHGLINKFQGDAVLAVFGAPLSVPGAASAALATARLLRDQLRQLPLVDFGIGVSAGSVFAGNIGAENRYEYTVIGDAVNEAARLADVAKTFAGRVVCSAAAIDRADQAERQHWASRGDTVLRGRTTPTHVFVPTGTSA